MRDVDDEDEDETPRDTWATVRRLWSEAAGDHRDLHIEAHSFPTRRSSDLLI